MRKMKDSGIAWIGEIPEGWSCNIGKRILLLQKREVLPSDEIITCFRDGEVTLRKNRREEGFTFSEKEIGYQGIEIGDIVIHGMDGFAGAIGISDSRGKGSPVLSVCIPKSNMDANYIVYYLRTLATNNVFLALATGIRERSCDLRWNKIANLDFILPNFEEQKQIADFLDKKCAEIDKLIELQESMIEKLKEYKQSVITQAVTKGLDPDVPMKDSGIEWIGKIPDGWEIIKIKDSFNLGKGLPITKADLLQNGVPVISYGQIHSKSNNGVSINDSLIRFVKEDYYKSAPYALVNKGDFIFADTSEDIEGCGNCVYLDAANSLFAGYHTIVMKSKKKQSNKYFAYLFKSDIWRSQIRTKVSGIKVFSVTQRILKDIQLLLPSNIIQQQIADYLDKKCVEIDDLIKLKEQKIEKLKEYKKSLIYEYVTGKKEVV